MRPCGSTRFRVSGWMGEVGYQTDCNSWGVRHKGWCKISSIHCMYHCPSKTPLRDPSITAYETFRIQGTEVGKLLPITIHVSNLTWEFPRSGVPWGASIIRSIVR